MSGLVEIFRRILTWDLKETLPTKNKSVHKKCRGTIYIAVASVKWVLSERRRFCCSRFSGDISRQLKSSGTLRTVALSGNQFQQGALPFHTPPPNLLPLSALQTPVQFSPFTKPTLLQVKPLTFTITCTCLCLRGDNTRFFFVHSIAASWVAHAIKMSAVLKETTLYVNLTFLNIYMQLDQQSVCYKVDNTI